VETAGTVHLKADMREQLRLNIKLAGQLGAKIITVHGEDIAEQIIHYANTSNITKIVIGRDQRKVLKYLKVRSPDIVDRVMDYTLNSDLHIIPGKPQDYKNLAVSRISIKLPEFRLNWQEIIKTLGVMAIATIFASLFRNAGLSDPNIVIIYTTLKLRFPSC